MKKISLEKIIKAHIVYKKALGHRAFVITPAYAEKHPEEAEKSAASVAAAKAALGDAAAGLKAAIAEAEGSCRERKITPIGILNWVDTIEGELMIPKTQMKGIKARVIDGSARFPSSYKYTPEATAVWLEHNGRSWSVTRIERVPCNFSHKVELELTDEAKAAVIDRLSRF